MGRRHDWTLRPELMRRKAVPVGNWPTVADIPPGALVLDSYGVVKQKVGDFLIPVPVTIIGYGPIASAPVASADNLGMLYLETGDPLWPNGRVWTSRKLGKFSGFDSVNLTMSESLSGKSTWRFDICGYFYSASTIYAPIYADQSTPGGGINNGIFQIERVVSGAKITVFYNGSAPRLTSTIDFFNDKFHQLTIERKADSKLYMTVDGVADGVSAEIATTAFVSAEIEIGGREVTRYPRMHICKVNVDGSIYKFKEGSGSKVYSSIGREGAITDGTPTDFWGAIQWVPLQ